MRLETRMSRAYTAPPPIKDEEGDEEQGAAGVAPRASVSPVKEGAVEGPQADRVSAGTPSAARRQPSFAGRPKAAKAAPSPRHSRQTSQQKACTSSATLAGIQLRPHTRTHALPRCLLPYLPSGST